MTKLKTYTAAEVVALRAKHNLSQTKFWGSVGVGQSTGSHYEAGRRIPRPVQLLIGFAYGSQSEAAAIVERLRNYRASLRRSPYRPEWRQA